MKILICGLPGAGKTTLAEAITPALNAVWFNADKVREQFNDWDFSPEGRQRQSDRMKTLCDDAVRVSGRIAIADFVAPTREIREHFDADFLIYVDTIPAGRFEDTNKMFVEPSRDEVHLIVKDWDWDMEYIISKIREFELEQ